MSVSYVEKKIDTGDNRRCFSLGSSCITFDLRYCIETYHGGKLITLVVIFDGNKLKPETGR